jgi:UDP-3-O-[3-hydroxymyristoyl] glucosamine N-acyltransferase
MSTKPIVNFRTIWQELDIDVNIIDPEHSMDEAFTPAPIDIAHQYNFTFCDHPGVPTKKPLEIIDGDPKPLHDTEKHDIRLAVSNSSAGIVICPDINYNDVGFRKTLVKTANPRYAFMLLVERLFPYHPHIHSTAVIHECVKLGDNISIGPGCLIGHEGFGYWRLMSDEIKRFPQIGGVVIEDNVEIHANVCIDRGALADTIIGEGSKIDNLVHVAHNCKIGKNVVIAANAMFAGGVEIGDNSWIAPSASILNGIKIGKNCVVGIGSVVLKDVPDNATVKGVPAK